jgi:phage-related protein
MNGDISYNSNDLQTYDPTTRLGIITNVIEHTNLPDKVASLYALADTNGSTIPTVNYPTRKVTIGGSIKGSSQSDLDSRLDTFKGYFGGKDKNLDIAYGSSTRRYVATANGISIIRKQKALYATFQVDFICTNPFGLDTSTTNLWAAKTGFTSATFTETPTIGGTAPYQLPLITITINSLTGAGDYVQISNDNNNQEMLIYGLALTASDVIIIDCAARTVTLNGTEVNYYGTFLELEPGANSITYTDGFTTRNVDVSAVYTKRWL